MRIDLKEPSSAHGNERARPRRGTCETYGSWGTNHNFTPLPGSLHLEWRRCGKASCRCVRGALHGPYVVRRWREHGKQRKVYVPRQRVEEVTAGIVAWQRLHPPAWTMRQLLADLRRLEHEVLG
jgi:hypothetical protein